MVRRPLPTAVLAIGVLAAGAVGGPLAAGPAAAASTAAAPAAAPSTAARIAQWNDMRCGFASAQEVRDDRPTTVRLAPATLTIGSIPANQWRKPASADPTWQLNLYSFVWLRPVAKRAFDDGQTKALARMVAQVDAFYVQNPDTGKSVRGWDEGSSLRRLENLNCLYSLTYDPRLAKRMGQEVALQFGPRYYGPPRHPVHNHGLMANLQVKRAGQLLGRKDWVERAKTRIRSEADLAFSAQGTSMEQSAAYHIVNRNMWLTAAYRLAEIDEKDPIARQIRAQMDKATVVGRWLTEPDGDLVQIGDSRRTAGLEPEGTERATAFRDDEAGLLVGRWSWTDPQTSYYTLRYGPPRWAHGHHDKAAVTWSTAGTRVLVGPGYYSYDWSNPYAVRARTLQAHNAAWAAGRKFNGRANATLRTAGSSRDIHRFTMRDKVYGVAHTRHVQIAGPAKRLIVKDTYPGKTVVRQSWHLDTKWQLFNQRGKTLNFVHPDGKRLALTTSGGFVSSSRGKTRPVAGWNHPTTGSRIANWEIVTGGTGTVTTTFQVR
ncbi:heparinase II/III domain-containing protein [Mobilicoccus caccae]|nr:heparinase II/III family protein [Mobilicoccus caccae]